MKKSNLIKFFSFGSFLVFLIIFYYISCEKKEPVDPLEDINKSTIYISEIGFDKSEISSGGESATLSVRLINKNSEPAKGKIVNFSAIKGEITENDTTDENGFAKGIYISNYETGTDTVYAFTLSYNNKEVKSYTTIEINEEKFVNRIEISADKEEILANGLETVNITAIVLDANEEPVSNKKINFYTLTGSIEESGYSDDNGEVILTYRGIASKVDTCIEVVSYLGIYPDNIKLADTLSINLKGVFLSVNAYPKVIKAGSDSTSKITVILKEKTSQIPISDGEIIFSTTMGIISATASTDNTGKAENLLYSSPVPGEASVVVRYGNTLKDSVKVLFTGINLDIKAVPSNLIADGITQSKITVTITNTSGHSIEGVDVSLSTNLGNLQKGFGSTNYQGEFIDYLTSSTPGIATVTANAGDEQKSVTVNFTGYIFSLWADPETFTASVDSTIITAELIDNNNDPVVSIPISFSTSIGEITNADSVTNFSGRANAILKSIGAGQAVVTAIAKVNDEEVHKDINISITSAPPNKVTLIADPGVVQVKGGESDISAIVTDIAGNPVKGSTVSFTILEGPRGGETINPAIVATNENGVASTKFISGNIGSSETNDVKIIARVQGTSIESNIVSLTISGDPKTIVLGYSDEITEVSGNYRIDISAIVTDINGNPVIDGTIVQFYQEDVIGGSIESDIPTTNGIATTTLTYPPQYSNTNVRIIAKSKGIQGNIDFTLPGVSGIAVSVKLLQPTEKEALANGEDFLFVKALVEDAGGSPISGITINFESDLGIIETSAITEEEITPEGAQNEDWGKATVRIIGPADSVDVFPTIIAKTGSLSDTMISSENRGVVFKGIDMKLKIEKDTVWSNDNVDVQVVLKRTNDQVAITGHNVYFGTTKGTIREKGITDQFGVVKVNLATGKETGIAKISAIYGNKI